ncbi:hypothetical protein AOQ84DRAFT_410266 [Glonium stellatum]|uniref:Nephrocystin 3-like N-terminal domain-containing protein n=1 Tax=Glonium stellatum TaxID=574774 RepID=A0A8E2JRD9_9PEZI|nr:hypothetical protein AOQ84DRAFT_410266 [Glonium stellatum]
MAEAFVAFGVAANVAQFIGYGLQLISQGKEIYGSFHGTRQEQLADQLLHILDELKVPKGARFRRDNHSKFLSIIEALGNTSKQTKNRLDRLRADIVSSTTDLSMKITALTREVNRVERGQKILESLIFETMRQRKSEIKDAHQRTLGWVFDEETSAFTDWLKVENGFFWMKGKAGSGKSTMMKYICNHDITFGTQLIC